MLVAIERKYAMIRIEAGDYLLPSNSGRSLWRLRRYYEGPETGIEKGRYVWSCARYSWMSRDFPAPHELGEVIEILNQDRWVETQGWLDTRQEAINEALECAERRGI
jgi:hypothetical protein